MSFLHQKVYYLCCGCTFQKQAADELGGDDFGRAGEEGLGKGWEGLGGYGSGLVDGLEAIGRLEVEAVEQRVSQSMQTYAYLHKHHIGHQVDILPTREHPRHQQLAD